MQHADPHSTRRTALLLLAAHVLSMLVFATFAVLLPALRDAWALSNTEAGTIGGIFFFGYIATVSYWTALTDQVDGRRVYAAGSLLAAAGCAGFGLLAEGFASACFFQVLMGAGMAATYMPGLRLLSDRASGRAQSRFVAFYTSFFGVGAAFSYALGGAVAEAAGWRAAFLVSAAGPVAAGVVVWFAVAPAAAPQAARSAFTFASLFPLAAWRKVMAIRAAAGYTLGYTVHSVELFASRGWMVAFLAFSASLHAPGQSFPWTAASIAAVVSVLSVPASILGNEMALRLGRRAWIVLMMTGAGLSGIALAASAPHAWQLVFALLVLYSMFVMADSATLTAGLIASAPAELRGAAMGFYSLCGFSGGMLGAPLFGAALDLAGGAPRPGAWVWAYAAIGAGSLAAPLVVLRASRQA